MDIQLGKKPKPDRKRSIVKALLYQKGEQVVPVPFEETSEYNMEEDDHINVPSLSAYEEIENFRAHVNSDFDNQINLFEKNYITNNINDNHSDLYKIVMATLYI